MGATLGKKIAGFLRSDGLPRLVTQGQVSCPHSRGDVDVDRCYVCPSYEGTFDDETGATWLRCKATRDRSAYRLS